MSLRARLTVALAVVVLLPLLAGAAVVGLVVPRVAAAASAERVETSVRAAAGELSRQCTVLGLSARALALEAAPHLSADEPVPARAAGDAVAGVPGVWGAVVDPDGDVLVSAGRAPAAAGEAGLAALVGRSCSADEAVRAHPLPAPGEVEPVPTEPVQVESVPVQGPGGELGQAVVVATLDPDAVEDLRARAGLPAGVVLLAEGRVLAAGTAGMGLTGEQLQDVAAAVHDRAASTGETGEAGLVAGEASGLRYAALLGTPGVPGVVVGVEPAGTSFLVWAVPLLLVTGAVLALLGTLALARRLTEPLTRLTRTVSALGAGDLDVRSSIRGDDEVGRLAAAVNAMADALQASVADIERRREAFADSQERFAEALARTHDLDGLMETVAQAVASAADVETCVVYLDHGSGLTERAVADLEVHSPATKPMLLSTARRCVARGTDVAEQVGAALQVHAVPMVHGRVVLGAVVLASRQGVDEQRLAAVRSLVRPAGTAVHNVLAHEEATRLSLTDPLTGLANFRSLSQLLSREMERSLRFQHPLSVLMLDVDRFKYVNDTWGHAVGDRVLRGAADRLIQLMREVDIVARYGGEEFLVILPETSVSGAREVAERVVAVIGTEPFGTVGDGEPLHVTVSVGVATYPDHADGPVDLMRRADDALYAAKSAGRNRCVVATLRLPSSRGAEAPTGG